MTTTMAAMLENAANLNIGYAIQNNLFTQTPEVRDDAVLKELHGYISDVAMHSSSARVDSPKCHEETREAVQQDLLGWSDGCVPGPKGEETDTLSIQVPSPPESSSSSPGGARGSVAAEAVDEILWLTGPAGTGKTAIMGTVSDRLEKKGKLAATFYFSESRGAAGTTSKERFVTTLAYQMVVHPGLNDRLASPMMAAIRKNPAVFRMSLERQLEILILAPLRALAVATKPALPVPTSIIVDGVDECGGSAGRSRQENQLEVLSVILKATKDPAFPFRIIVASRPETWIRGFLDESAAGRVHEIFLDEKYSPDDDVRLFLKSKLAERRRRAGISSAWPRLADIETLVDNASGQFIYAATVVRWVETPGTSPQAQLNAVLNLKIPPGAESHPLAMLDALYTSILKSTPNPDTTVLWLKGLHHVQQVYASSRMRGTPSAWTLDRLFESHEGQAQSVLGGLPSLIYKLDSENTDLAMRKEEPGLSVANGLSTPECKASYAFYHKSFLDYLDGDSRCGGAFPTLTGAKRGSWLDARISQTLKSPGAEVFMSQPLRHTFQACFMDLVVHLLRNGPICLDVTDVGDGIPDQWIRALEVTPALHYPLPRALRALYVLVHSNCHQGRPCNRGCKRWRRAISKLPSEKWCTAQFLRPWTKEDLHLDRFCIKRLPVETAWRTIQ